MVRTLALLWLLTLAAPADAAMWATLRWTNPPQPVDTLRCLRVHAPGDTASVSLYSSTSPLVAKLPGSPGQSDSAYLSVSVANVVGPAAIRIHLALHNGAGWSGPSNALSLFYAARDTLYLGPPGGGLPGAGWWRGPGLFTYAQPIDDATWVDWRHAEIVQRANRAEICRTYGYACRRGVRDTAWCSAP